MTIQKLDYLLIALLITSMTFHLLAANWGALIAISAGVGAGLSISRMLRRSGYDI